MFNCTSKRNPFDRVLWFSWPRFRRSQVDKFKILVEYFIETVNLAVYYNAAEKSCQEFNYGGCGGNNNRFDTMEQCEDQCHNALGLDVCADCKLAIAYLGKTLLMFEFKFELKNLN